MSSHCAAWVRAIYHKLDAVCIGEHTNSIMVPFILYTSTEKAAECTLIDSSATESFIDY
jgi:hypothetical protein